MAILEIVKKGEPGDEVLHKVAAPINTFGPELRALVNDMFETMHDAKGCGLAAPQIGQSIRLVVIAMPKIENDPMSEKTFVLVNPQIVERNTKVAEAREGCLSIPGWIGDVKRHTAITVQARNEWGKPKTIKAQDFLARVLQHEIDHLDGILYLDRLEGPDKLRPWEPKDDEQEAGASQSDQVAA